MEPINDPDRAGGTGQSPVCAHCGEILDAGWDFCGHCGSPSAVVRAGSHLAPVSDALLDEPGATATTELVPAVPVAVEHDAPTPGRRPRLASVNKRRAAFAGVAVVVVALLVIATLSDLGTRHRLSSTRARLTTTERTLTATRSDLTTANKSLHDRTAERDALQAKLDAANTQLQGLQGSLNDAKANISAQSNQITVLKSCLTGVATALGDVAEEDYNGAVGALESVDSVCRQASQYL